MAKDDEDYKGRSGAASYGARKTYRSKGISAPEGQTSYEDKSIGLSDDSGRVGAGTAIRDTQAELDAGTLEQKENLAKGELERRKKLGITDSTTGTIDHDFTGTSTFTKFNTALQNVKEKLSDKIFGKPIMEITDPNQLALIEKLIRNSVGNKPTTNILEDFANAIASRFDIVLGDEELYRDDDKGIEIGSDADEFITPGSLTGEGLDKIMRQELGDDVWKSLQKFDPQMHFLAKGLPQTSGGLETFGQNKPVDTSNMDRNSREYEEAVKYNNAIFEAREITSRTRDRRGDNQGVRSIPLPNPLDPLPDPTDPIPPQQPTLPPGFTPLPSVIKYPDSVMTDYTQLGLPNIYGNQQMPNYANFYQGQQPVGLQNYLDNLRKRFGIG
mgnify:CR=1 FL=1